MKICYLILCHTNEDQVASLIDQLSDDSVDIFVHVDKKAQGFKLPQRDNVYAVEDSERVDISWGDMGMVRATMKLIDLAIEHGRYDYVALISGQCFPIKTNKEIFDFLNGNKGKNFIDVNLFDDPAYSRMRKRIDLYYPSFLRKRGLLPKVLKRIYVTLTGGRGRTFKLFRRRLPCGMEFAYGSSWWTLTYDALKWIRDYVRQNEECLDFFENSLNPDESFFQMLFMLSPYSEEREGILTYLEWEHGGNHPRVLRECDVKALLSRPEMFARKFDIRVDASAIEVLAQNLKD